MRGDGGGGGGRRYLSLKKKLKSISLLWFILQNHCGEQQSDWKRERVEAEGVRGEGEGAVRTSGRDPPGQMWRKSIDDAAADVDLGQLWADCAELLFTVHCSQSVQVRVLRLQPIEAFNFHLIAVVKS